MTEYGRYILEAVEEIREKNELIKKSKLDFKSFNNYRIMLAQIENFDIHQSYSDDEFVRKMNEFVFKVDKLFENIILDNHLRKEALFDYTLNEDILFYEALKQIKLFGERQDFTQDELAHFLQELKELVNNKNFSPNQEELLHQSIKLFEEELIPILEDTPIQNTQYQENSNRIYKR